MPTESQKCAERLLRQGITFDEWYITIYIIYNYVYMYFMLMSHVIDTFQHHRPVHYVHITKKSGTLTTFGGQGVLLSYPPSIGTQSQVCLLVSADLEGRLARSIGTNPATLKTI